MLKIAICDDLEEIRKEINTILTKGAKELNIEISVDEFSSGEELVKTIENETYFDLIFLDIEMHKLSGIDVARYIRDNKHNYSTQIAFVTGKGEYIKSVFEVTTLNFIEKPIKSIEIIKTIKQVLNIQRADKQYFSYKIENQYHNIQYKQIYYFEIEKKKVSMYTKQGKIEFSNSLKKIEEKLDMSKFIKVHQSFIVNKSKIEKIDNNFVLLFNLSKEIPIAKDRKKTVVKVVFDNEHN